jgi:hypothetical protein
MAGIHANNPRDTTHDAHPIVQPVRRDEPMDDEEKILANRSDANIPAMLTRDVKGG